MWSTDRIKTSKRKKQNDDANIPRFTHFNEYVIQKYNDLLLNSQKEKNELTDNINTLLKEQQRIADDPSRGLIRRKNQITMELKKLEKKLEEIQQGRKIEEFKTQILPYTEAYERELQVHSVDKLRESTSVPSLLPKDEEEKPHEISGVMKEFMQEVENILLQVKVMPSEICDECDDVMVLESRSSTLVCSTCGNWKHYLDATSSHMAYGEEVEFTAFAYLRLNHFNERLTYSQSKESTRIALEDIEKIIKYLIEKRVTDVEKISMEMTYGAAKALKLRHIYKQNTQLWCKITGKPPPRLSPESEEQLRSMFRAVNRLWPKYKPDERKNFLSYNYCLYKFCEMLGLDEQKNLFKLLKGDKKLEKQDEIFKKICGDAELQWEFIPSKHDE